jgi:enoyl-CoA hydratase/carnithine racemase
VSTFTHIHYHKVEKYQSQYAVLTLNRPQKAHAYNQAMLFEMETHFLDIQKKTNICALIIQSTGHRVFCAGADLFEMKEATAVSALHLLSERVFSLLEKLQCVTIAAIHGPAIAGGFEMTMACDLRVISPNATFSLPEVSLGLIPAAGGCIRLPNVIGMTRAKAVILGGHTMTSQEGLDWGFANVQVPDPQSYASQWAEKIASFDSTALRFAKNVLDSNVKKETHLQAKTLEGILYHRKNKGDCDK